MAEKITTILIGILISIGLFLAGYMANQKILAMRQSQTATMQNPLESNSLVKRFNKESPEPARINASALKFPNSIITSGRKNDEIIVYDRKTGKIKIASLNTELTEDKETIQSGAQNIQWSIDRQKILAQYSNDFIFYDFEQKTQQKYGSDIVSPKLNRQGDKIIYMLFDDKDSGSIRISDPLLKISKDVLATRTKTWQISWLNDTLVGLVNRQSYNKLSAFILDVNKKSLKQIIDTQYVTDILWTPDGNGYLYSYYDSASKLRLEFRDFANKSTTFENTTFASRCIWNIDSATFYCLIGEKLNDTSASMLKMHRDNSKDFQTLTKEKIQIPESFMLTIDEQKLITHSSDGAVNIYPTQP